MKRRLLLTAGLLSTVAARLGSAQTKVALQNIQGPASTAGLVNVILPDGRLAVAAIGTGIRLDLTANPPVLSAVTPTLPADKTHRVKVPATGAPPTSITIPEAPAQGNTPVLTLNGITLLEGDDYTTSADGRTFTFVSGQQPGNSALIVVRYRA